MPALSSTKARRGAYALTIFLSALLLFAVQPMAGKHLLPYFGGTSAVWAASLLFFMAALFAGYAYVYFLCRLPPKRQAQTHAALAMLAGAYALFTLALRGSLFPSLEWTVGSAASPLIDVILALVVSVGAPYLLLSTTGPLLQYWYGLTEGEEPYRLYSLSNVGSFAALLGYPFVIEPLSSLAAQERVWNALFILYSLAAVAISYRFLRFAHAASPDARVGERVSMREAIVWTLAAALPSYMLVATTTQVTQAIAPVPLLWVVPLAIYLITFILAFNGWTAARISPAATLLLALAAFQISPAGAIPQNVAIQAVANFAVLFAVGMLCHGWLYRSRPQLAQLPLFYLLLSLGGALGALCVSVLAPLLFAGFWEFPLGVALSIIVAALMLPVAFFPHAAGRYIAVATKGMLAVIAVLGFAQAVSRDFDPDAITSRNFYGVTTVEIGEMTRLLHGTTLHGAQFTEPEDSYIPTTYYAPPSGIGRAIVYAQDHKPGGIRAAVIGLGTGTTAAYCRKGDTFVFYEIDRRIVEIATTYFSYLPRCEDSEVRIGDARKVLERERAEGEAAGYDVLAVDAFSDDAIPVHLLTKEAVELYISRLSGEESILAIHTSNRYLDLSPIVLRLAAETGMSAAVMRDTGEGTPGASPSEWVLLARSPAVFRSNVFANSNWEPGPVSAPVWTDNQASILPIIMVPLSFR